jgi:hypothetical protein
MHFMPYILYMCDVYNVFLQKKITVIQYYLQIIVIFKTIVKLENEVKRRREYHDYLNMINFLLDLG